MLEVLKKLVLIIGAWCLMVGIMGASVFVTAAVMNVLGPCITKMLGSSILLICFVTGVGIVGALTAMWLFIRKGNTPST